MRQPRCANGGVHEKYSTEYAVEPRCTTTCLALVSKVVNDKFGTDEGLMAAMHAIAATQLIVYGLSRSGTRVRSSSPPLRREHSCQGGPRVERVIGMTF